MLTAQSTAANRVRQVLTAKNRDWLTSGEAASIAGITRVGMLGWYERHPGLAYKVGTRWRIVPEALVAILSGVPLPKKQESTNVDEGEQGDLFVPRQ